MATRTSTQNDSYNGMRGARQDGAERRGSARPAERQAKAFLALARDRFAELERLAAAAADELDAELLRVVEALRKEDPEEATRIEAFGETLVEHQRTVAERSAYLRRRLERRGHLETSPRLFGRRADDSEAEDADPAAEPPPPANGGRHPSEGVVLLARQMAALGADERKIGRVLTRLGVDHADEAVSKTFR